MKALLLAGGLGTRLRPLTYTRPKHLLPIANRAHIDLVLDHLQAHGVDDVVLTTSYLAEAFDGTVQAARRRGLAVEVTHEHQALGTAGALKHAEDALRDGTFLALNADVLTDADLTRLVDFHHAKGAAVSLLLTRVEDPSAFGVVPTDPDDRVTGFVEKPVPGEAPTNLINAGVYVMEPSVLDLIPAGREWSSERQLFPEVVRAGGMFALHLPSYWIDIGTPEKYLTANLDAIARGAPGVAPDVEVAADAVVVRSAIGEGCTIGASAHVERSVLLPGVQVEPNVRVSRSVLGENVRVGAGVVLEDQTIGDAEVVGAQGAAR